MEQRPLDGWGKGGIVSQLFRLCDDRGLHSSAPAGVDRSGRGFNPRPAQDSQTENKVGGLYFKFGAGLSQHSVLHFPSCARRRACILV